MAFTFDGTTFAHTVWIENITPWNATGEVVFPIGSTLADATGNAVFLLKGYSNKTISVSGFIGTYSTLSLFHDQIETIEAKILAGTIGTAVINGVSYTNCRVISVSIGKIQKGKIINSSASSSGIFAACQFTLEQIKR